MNNLGSDMKATRDHFGLLSIHFFAALGFVAVVAFLWVEAASVFI